VRLYEFEHGKGNTPENNLLTALELIQHRYKDRDQLPKINTQSLINMVLNTDRTFSYDSLVAANDSNPAVKNLIKSFNKNYVELNPISSGDEAETVNPPEGNPTQNPVDDVNSMATRAAKKRDADLF